MANGARSAAGVSLLDLQVVVAGAARDHSAAMRDFDFVGHSGPDGTLVERLAAAGVAFKSAAENLGRTSGVMDPASWTHEQLMASPPNTGSTSWIRSTSSPESASSRRMTPSG